MTRHRATIPDLDNHETTSRELMVFVVKAVYEIREQVDEDSLKLDRHLALHSVLNRALVWGIPTLLAAASVAVAVLR